MVRFRSNNSKKMRLITTQRMSQRGRWNRIRTTEGKVSFRIQIDKRRAKRLLDSNQRPLSKLGRRIPIDHHPNNRRQYADRHPSQSAIIELSSAIIAYFFKDETLQHSLYSSQLLTSPQAMSGIPVVTNCNQELFPSGS